MKKIFSKVLVSVFAIIILLGNVALAEDTTLPKITASVESNSVVESGTKVIFLVTDDSNLQNVFVQQADGTKVDVLKEMDKVAKVRECYATAIITETSDVYIEAVDIHGNKTGMKKFHYIVEEDNSVPTITPSIKSNSVVKEGTQVIFVVRNDVNLKSVLVKKADGTKVDVLVEKDRVGKVKECTAYVTITETSDVYIEAIDIKGNTTGMIKFHYIVEGEKIPPTIEATPGSGKVNAGDTLTVVVSDNKVLKDITYSWNDEEEETPLKNGNGKEYDQFTLNMGKFPNVNDEYVLTVIATDMNGNRSEKTFNYTVVYDDKTAPEITMSKPSGSVVEGGTKLTMVVKDMQSKITSLKYNWVGANEKILVPNEKEPANTCTVYIPKIGTKAGTYNFTVTAINSVGLKTANTYTYYVKGESDNTLPTVVVSPNGGNVKPNEDIKITGKDNEGLASVTYNWDDEDPVTKPLNGKEDSITTEVPNTPGKHTLHVTVKDEAGNEVKDTIEFTVGDDEDPTITMNPKDKSTVKGGKIVKATLKDNVELKKVTYAWEDDDDETKNLSGTSKTIELPKLPYKEGTYKVTITVEDTSGNKTTGKYTYYVEEDDDDEEYPTVDADPDGGDVEFGDKITITAEDEDGEIEYVEFYWDDDDDDTTKKYKDEFTVKVPSEEGKHYLYVRARDDDDNLCDYERFTYNVKENKYPGNSDIVGDVNTRVRALRVEIRNADDKIRFEPEEEILYYVDYYNGTSSKVTNAKLVVDLPTYLEAEEASDKGQVTSKKVTWNLGTLDAGEYGRVSFVAKYTSDKVNEKIITVPAKIYSGSSLKDTSTVRNMIFSVDASGTGNHQAYCVGYPDGTFRAEGKITRAELASMIANIEGITATYRGQFSDVNNHWAANYIQAVVDRGYMKPSGYSSFGAQAYATRADLAYAIAAILDVHDLEPIFVSASDTKNNDARCAIEQLLRLGIMDGYSDGTAKPNSNVTRAEAVTIINNYLFRGELYTKGYSYSYNFETNYNHGGNYYILKFTDLSSNHWAYGHIMDATNNHRYERIMDGNEEML